MKQIIFPKKRNKYFQVAYIETSHRGIRDAFVSLWLFGRIFRLEQIALPLIRLARFSRKLFPYFYSIGLRDCDTGGRVFAWYVDWGINYWHAEKRLKRWDGAGDGEVIHQVTFAEFIRAKRYQKKEEE